MNIRTMIIYAVICCVTLSGCGNTNLGESSVSSANSGLSVFQQEILYDRRGDSVNAILLHHTILIVNEGDNVVEKVSIQYNLTPEQAQYVDLESFFGLMADILPSDVVLPPIEQIDQLLVPDQEKLPDGGISLRWAQSNIPPKSGILIYFGSFHQSGESFTLDKQVVTPLATMRATGQYENNIIHLEYKITNTSNITINGIRIGNFIPNKISEENTGEMIPLYQPSRWYINPEPFDFIKETMAIDGTLQMAEGSLLQFNSDRLEAGEELAYEITIEVQPTGLHGGIIPYTNLVYNATLDSSQNPNLVINPSSKIPIRFLPTLFICNVGWPDWISIPF